MHTFQYKTQDWIKNNYKEGKKVKGIVKNIKPYGAFIEIEGGVVGLAHIEDLSIARIKTPYERLQIGQKVDVVVKSIEKNTGRITLSYKETLGTWEENANKFSKGMKTKGIITSMKRINRKLTLLIPLSKAVAARWPAILLAMVPKYVLFPVSNTIPVADPLTTFEPMKQMLSNSMTLPL